MSTLMMLGPVQFRVVGLNAQSVKSERKVPFAEHKVIGSEPIKEFMAFGEETVKIKGKIFPFHEVGEGGLSGISALKAARDAAVPLPLVRGFGGGGWYVIENVEVDEDQLSASGTGQEVDFTVSLSSVPSPGQSVLGAILQLFGI